MAFTTHDAQKGLEDSNTSRAMTDAPSMTDESPEKLEAPSTPKIPDVEVMNASTWVGTLEDWNGPDDPGNPVNWPVWSRCYHTIVPALYGFVVSFGSSAYTPGYPEVSQQFHVGTTTALLPLSLYVLGLAFGPILAAPLSETFGRRVVYLSTLPLSALFTLGAGFSPNFASRLVCRFFAGFLGSPSLAVGAGTNADIWPPVNRAVATSLFVLASFLGPALDPMVGEFAAQYKRWRWTQVCQYTIRTSHAKPLFRDPLP